MNTVALIVFIIVQILFLPLAIIGVILVTYKQLFLSKKLGVSQTAVEVINGRWAMDRFGIRDDPASVKLAAALPNNSILGLWLALFPLYLRYRISGEVWLYPKVADRGEEGVSSIVINRTLYFDEILERAQGDVEQFVIMGAGFDTRCYDKLNSKGLSCFELDQANTQCIKRDSLKRAAIDASHIHFVEVNFAAEQWFEKLKEARYDPNKKTIFLWEGVTLYLGEQDVCNTLRQMKSHAPAGSIIAVDFYAKEFVTGEMYPGMKTLLKALKVTDESFGFGIDFTEDHEAELKNFVESEGLTVGAAYFMGAKTKKGTWMVVTEVKV